MAIAVAACDPPPSESPEQRKQDEDRQLVLRLVPSARQLAARYRHSGEAQDDLEQVACIGLLTAVDRYNPARGGGFTATPCRRCSVSSSATSATRAGRCTCRAERRELALRVSDAPGTLPAKLGARRARATSPRRWAPVEAEIAERVGVAPPPR